MSQAKAMTFSKREENYKKQRPGRYNTPRQDRRLRHKLNKALGI